MKRMAAVLITVGVLAGALWLSRSSKQGENSVAAYTPETCIERMFTAAERGDVAVYLDCFTGDERRRLERELADQTPLTFGRSLQQALQELKGRAIFAASAGDISPVEARLTAERVYVNRTERQIYRLVREDNRWRIAGVQAAQPYQPANAYGTPVFDVVPAPANMPPASASEPAPATSAP